MKPLFFTSASCVGLKKICTQETRCSLLDANDSVGLQSCLCSLLPFETWLYFCLTVLTRHLSPYFAAVSTQAAGEREAERVDGVQREVQGALRVAHQHGEQGLPKRRHQHRGDDREASQGKRARKHCPLRIVFAAVHLKCKPLKIASISAPPPIIFVSLLNILLLNLRRYVCHSSSSAVQQALLRLQNIVPFHSVTFWLYPA